MQWISDYENAFAELEELECNNWDNKARKRRILKNVSANHGLDKFVFKQITKDMSSSEVLEHLRAYSIQSDKAAENKAFRKARMGATDDELDYDRIAQRVLKAMKADVTQQQPLSVLEKAC